MTPDQLAKSGTEHSQQRALFAFVAVAARHGFPLAWEWADSGNAKVFERSPFASTRIEAHPALGRLYAIPNGGYRDKITAGKLKAEGVKRGVPDVFLPMTCQKYAGLYVELKRPKTDTQRAGTTSAEQDDWIGYLRSVGYAVAVAFNWREAAKQIEQYVNECGG